MILREILKGDFHLVKEIRKGIPGKVSINTLLTSKVSMYK